MLTPAEKNKFLKAMSDPSSELAQQLLSLDELQNQISEPWWTSLPVVPTNRFSTDKVTYPPSEMEIPASLLKPIPGRPLLAYNLAAIGFVVLCFDKIGAEPRLGWHMHTLSAIWEFLRLLRCHRRIRGFKNPTSYWHDSSLSF